MHLISKGKRFLMFDLPFILKKIIEHFFRWNFCFLSIKVLAKALLKLFQDVHHILENIFSFKIQKVFHTLYCQLMHKQNCCSIILSNSKNLSIEFYLYIQRYIDYLNAKNFNGNSAFV